MFLFLRHLQQGQLTTRKQCPSLLKLGKRRRLSSTCNYYMISPKGNNKNNHHYLVFEDRILVRNLRCDARTYTWDNSIGRVAGCEPNPNQLTVHMAAGKYWEVYPRGQSKVGN